MGDSLISDGTQGYQTQDIGDYWTYMQGRLLK